MEQCFLVYTKLKFAQITGPICEETFCICLRVIGAVLLVNSSSFFSLEAALKILAVLNYELHKDVIFMQDKYVRKNRSTVTVSKHKFQTLSNTGSNVVCSLYWMADIFVALIKSQLCE